MLTHNMDGISRGNLNEVRYLSRFMFNLRSAKAIKAAGRQEVGRSRHDVTGQPTPFSISEAACICST